MKKNMRKTALSFLLMFVLVIPLIYTTPAKVDAATTVYLTGFTRDGAMLDAILTALENGNYSTTTYNSTKCIKFTTSKYTIYVKASAFNTSLTASSYPTADSISRSLTTKLNNNVSSYVYSDYRYSIYDQNIPGYCWYIAQYGSNAYYYSGDELVLGTKVLHALYFHYDNTTNKIISVSKTSSDLPLTPTMGVQITNTGSGSNYFGGYYMKGLGANTSKTDISTIINLGYKTAKIGASVAVSGLKASTFYDLYSLGVDIGKATSGSYKSYLSTTEPLSSGKKYSYKVSMKAPYKLKVKGNYYQMHIGLKSSKSTTYSVTYNFSH